MADVFISYAREDRAGAARIAAALESRQWSVWWDRELIGGQNFRRKIAEALAEARCVLVLWTQASLESNWVLDEAQDGLRRSILVPVQLADALEPPLGFRSFQTISLEGWLAGGAEPDSACLADLFRAVQRAMAGTATVEQPDFEESVCEPVPAGGLRAGKIEAERVDEDHRPAARVEPAPAPRRGTAPKTPDVPAPGPGALARWLTRARTFRPRHLVTTKAGLGALLGIVFVLNYVETQLETFLGWSPGWQAHVLESFRWFERYIDFESHDRAGSFAVGGFTLSYFGLFPLLAAIVAVELYRRESLTPFRVLSLSTAVNYAVSLPFFLLLPVRERWADPASGAMLLSDRAHRAFIELFRPFSGLDNCFPSFHTSLTVALIVLGFLYATRLSWCLAALGLTVVLSTFALGIHWLPDIAAGASLGVVSVGLARRLDLKITAWELAVRA